MRSLCRGLLVAMAFVCLAGCGATPTPQPTATAPARVDQAARSAELVKFDNPQDHLVKAGPAGTDWDRQYRSFIQTEADATSKGLPTHAQAAQQIKPDAAQSNEKLQMHKSWVLYIKHFSQAYRPESATADLKQLYTDLVDMEFGVAAATAANALPFEGDARLRILRDVAYGTADPLQRLDAYLVKGNKPSPVLVEVHGGGWRRGQKSQFADVYPGDLIGKAIAAGISVVSIDYRLAPAYQHPAQVQDLARAIQFIRIKAKEWNIDGGRIAAMGGSAGAHMAAWAALHDDMANAASRDALERQSTRLSCFVDMWGPMDLTRVNPLALSKEPLRGEDFANAYIAMFGTTLEGYNTLADVQARVRDASPLFHVSQDDPPAFIMTAAAAEVGRVDHPPVPETINDPHSAWQGVLLADRMDSAGLRAVRYIGPEVGKDARKDNAAILAFLQTCIAP